MNLFEELMGLAHELDAHGVESALVGGLAVAVWGVKLRDIDR